jgi:hypothetical protein
MEFINNLINFFVTKEFTFRSKIFGFIMIIVGLFLIDNLLGFSFYYSTNKKISQLKDIESLKRECDNLEINKTLNDLENDIIHRENIVNRFFNLFSKEPFDIKTDEQTIKRDTVFIIKYDTIYLTGVANIFNRDKILTDSTKPTRKSKNDSVIDISKTKTNALVKPPKTRSRLWHTLSSSYSLILLIIVFAIVPFAEKKFIWNTFLGILILIIILAGFIWLFQFLFGLIPLIFNRPWINYVLNFSVQTCFWIVFGYVVNRNEKKKEKKKAQMKAEMFR